MSDTTLATVDDGSLATTIQSAAGYQSRQEAARKACEAAGIVWPGTILPPGTALYESGVEKLKSDRAAWRRLPLAAEVIGLVAEALKAEDRQDYPADVSDLRFRLTDGRLVRKQNMLLPPAQAFGLGYGPHTLRQLVGQMKGDSLVGAPDGFATALLYLDDGERAAILNKRMDTIEPQKRVTLRTRVPHQGDGSRIARAALSSRYGSVTDHDIAGAIGEMLAGDRTGRLDYKPGDQRSRFEVVWPSEIPVETFVVGDVHYGMLSVTNSETGEGGLRIAPAVVRAACANLTISTGEGTEINIRHVGDSAALVQRLKKAIRLALDDVTPLLETISQSAKIPAVEAWAPEKLFANIAKRYSLPAAAAESWLDEWKAGYSQVPQTVFAMTAAISQAAHHTETWADEAEWERVASTVQARAVEVVRAGTPAALALEKALALN